MVTTVRTVVYEHVIAGWTLRVDGLIRRYSRSLTREVVFQAKLKGPKRSGNLVRSISDKHQWANQYGCGRVITASAPYAGYVMGGTKANGAGWIRAKMKRGPGGRFTGRGWLPVGKSQGKITNFKQAVKGQKANPFIQEALRSTMLRWGLLT